MNKALEKLQNMWSGLVFAKVTNVVARPEDIVGSLVREFIRTDDGPVLSRTTGRWLRPGESPSADEASRVEHNYAKFHGFASRNIFFHSSANRGLDLDIDITMTWSKYGNHKATGHAPKPGDVVCGDVEQTAKGLRFAHWFVCQKPVERLIHMVQSGESLPDEELAECLYEGDGGFPDRLWAIARLVFHGNAQAFMREHGARENRTVRDPHPCRGKKLPGWDYRCRNDGMYLPVSPDEFVHKLGHALDEPAWWHEFTAAHEIVKHHVSGGFCVACKASEPTTGGYWMSEDGYGY